MKAKPTPGTRLDELEAKARNALELGRHKEAVVFYKDLLKQERWPQWGGRWPSPVGAGPGTAGADRAGFSPPRVGQTAASARPAVGLQESSLVWDKAGGGFDEASPHDVIE